MEQKNRYGFTLIELLVVISIIAILASMIIVGVSALRKKANKLKVKNFVTDVSSACTNFKMNTLKGKYPFGDIPDDGYLTANFNKAWRELNPSNDNFDTSIVVEYNVRKEDFVFVDPREIQGFVAIDLWGKPYEAQYDWMIRKVIVWSFGEDQTPDFGGNGSPSTYLTDKPSMMSGNPADPPAEEIYHKDVISPF